MSPSDFGITDPTNQAAEYEAFKEAMNEVEDTSSEDAGEIMLGNPDPGEDSENGRAAYEKLKKAASKFNETELQLANWLRDVYRQSTPMKEIEENKGPLLIQGSDVFKGANIRLQGDEGMLYEKLKSMPGLKIAERTGKLSGSSHQSDKDQFEIQLPGAGVVLVGVSENYNGVEGTHTWIQSERHAANGTVLQSLGHGGSYFKHVKSGFKQIGAFGESPYSEKKIDGGKFVSERDANPLVCRSLPVLAPKP